MVIPPVLEMVAACQTQLVHPERLFRANNEEAAKVTPKEKKTKEEGEKSILRQQYSIVGL